MQQSQRCNRFKPRQHLFAGDCSRCCMTLNDYFHYEEEEKNVKKTRRCNWLQLNSMLSKPLVSRLEPGNSGGGFLKLNLQLGPKDPFYEAHLTHFTEPLLNSYVRPAVVTYHQTSIEKLLQYPTSTPFSPFLRSLPRRFVFHCSLSQKPTWSKSTPPLLAD